MTQPCDEGGGVPMAVRHRGDAPFATRGASVAPAMFVDAPFHPERPAS